MVTCFGTNSWREFGLLDAVPLLLLLLLLPVPRLLFRPLLMLFRSRNWAPRLSNGCLGRAANGRPSLLKLSWAPLEPTKGAFSGSAGRLGLWTWLLSKLRLSEATEGLWSANCRRLARAPTPGEFILSSLVRTAPM